MNGQEKEEIRQGLLQAYNKKSLAQMLSIRLNKDLEEYVTDGALRDMVWELLDRTEEEGWTADLVREAHRHNPGNQTLTSVYEKFGMMPKYSLFHDGAALPPTEAKPSAAALEKVIMQGNPTLDINPWRIRLSEVEARVCRIDIGGRGTGTGFLVGPDTVLTNYHVMEAVIKGTKQLSSVTCLFDFKVLANNQSSPGIRVPLASPQGLLAFSPYSDAEKAGTPEAAAPTADELDFALLRLARRFADEPADRARGFEILPADDIDFAKDQGIIIAQHPNAAPMKLAIDTQSVIAVNANATRVRYKTNTEGGSSGSPVYDMEWRLSALHHYGDPSFLHPAYNQGVIQLRRIREKVAAAGFSDALGNSVL